MSEPACACTPCSNCGGVEIDDCVEHNAVESLPLPQKLMSTTELPQQQVLENLLSILFPTAGTILDSTWGKGYFWTGSNRAVVGSDLKSGHVLADFRQLPFVDGQFDVVVYDPPFQPETTKNVPCVIEKRFTTPVRGVDQMKLLVQEGVKEAFRVSKQGVIVKCQDYIHDHKPVWMSLWLRDVLGDPYDFCNVVRKSKLIASNWSRQRSVWRNHSTFWVWSKVGGR